jgi:LPXTG-motif cell wall-anchored protein
MVSAAHGTTVFFTEVLSASAEGEANFSFTVPADAGDDQIMVTVSGELSGTTTEVLAVAVAATTPGTPVTTSPALARTGQDLLMVGAIGLVLLMAGVLAVRRRRASTPARDTTRIDV